MIPVTKTSDQTRQRMYRMYVCMYIFIKLHIITNRAIRPCHPSHSMPLALILPRGDQWYLLRKPLVRRDRGDTLSLLVQFLLEPWVPCAPPPASLLLSRLSGLAATEPTLSFLHYFLFPCMYVCTVCMLIITYELSMDQPGKVTNPAGGQLNRENWYFSDPVRAWEFGLGRWVRPSRPALVCSFSILRLNLVLNRRIPPDSRGGVYLFIQLIRHRVSPKFIGSRNCVPVSFTAESPSAQGQ